LSVATNAFISSNGNLSLDASSAGSTFDVVSSKTITTVGTISAGTLKLSGATGSNAGLLLQSDLIVNNTAQLIADGSGNILQSGGIITAQTVSFVSGSGNIGSNNVPIQMKASNVSA